MLYKKETTTSEDKSIFDVQTLDIVNNDKSSIENSDSDDTNDTTEDNNASHDNTEDGNNLDGANHDNHENNIVIKDKNRAIELSSFS